ncbi:MAG TPA: hypothetical protein VFH51_07995, partial [Myxococcota bacterium]|nr:hypothetical protein [Myxococcota bacterium]
VTCEVARGGPLFAAAYPRLLRNPGPLDDINRLWYYPDGFEAADMSLSRDGTPLPGQGVWEALGETAPGDRVTLQFTTHVPARQGTFGQRDGVTYLLGGWHPVMGAPGALPPGPIAYEVRVPAGTVGLVGRQPFGRRSPRLVTGSFHGRYVPLLVAPGADVQIASSAVLISPRNRRGEPAGHADLTAPLDASAEAEVLKTLAEGAAFAGASGEPLPPLVAVIAPLRAQLVEPFDGGLAISDRAFHVLPVERIRKFHRAALWREQFAVGLRRRVEALEDTLPPEVAADAVASAWLSDLLRARYGDAEYAPDLLERVAVIPEIDALIFAPQVPFIETYYNAIDETTPARWRLDAFYHALPRGKLLFEKLKDRVGEANATAALRAYLGRGAPLLASLERRFSGDLAPWLRTWLGPYPRVDYGVTPLPHAGPDARVMVTVQGPDAGRIDEPLTVRAMGADGRVATVSRWGPGALVLPVPAPLQVVELDPAGRLVELWHPEGYGPRYNNRVPPRWRFLLNDFSGLLAVTNRQLTLSLDFSLRQLHDLSRLLSFYALYSPASVGTAV